MGGGMIVGGTFSGAFSFAGAGAEADADAWNETPVDAGGCSSTGASPALFALNSEFSFSILAAASAALRRAVPIGSAMGFAGCHGNFEVPAEGADAAGVGGCGKGEEGKS